MKASSFLLVAVFSLAGSSWAAKAPALTPELLAKGKASFGANCKICHGEKGDGNGMVGKTMNPKPRDFATGKFKNGDKVEQIFATLTNGLQGTAMTSYKHLSAEDRRALAYYVRSFRAPNKSKH